jgi:hypothetical protein
MNYQQIYHNIINRGKNRVLTEYKESHHILPRCMGGTDDPKNLVDLTPEEHYLCHLLLVKLNPGHIGLVRAAMFLTSSNNGVRRNNKMYGWIKRQYSDYMRGPNNPQKLNPRSGERHHYFGKQRPPSSEWLTTSGRQLLTDKMLGSKNPCAGVKPWNHPRATDYSKSVWKQADLLYYVWTTHNKPSYCKLYTLWNNKCYTNESKVIGPYMNMVKYFKNGWIPTQDPEWVGFIK